MKVGSDGAERYSSLVGNVQEFQANAKCVTSYKAGSLDGGVGHHVVHTVALLPEGSHSTMAQTGVSGPVVVDGESFSDALFASAGQG